MIYFFARLLLSQVVLRRQQFLFSQRFRKRFMIALPLADFLGADE